MTGVYGFISVRVSFSFVYLNQIVQEKYISKVGGIYYGMDGLTVFTQAVYFGLISSYSEYYIIFQIGLAIVLLIVAVLFLVDSPSDLIFRG